MAALTDCPGITQRLHPLKGSQRLHVKSNVISLTVPQGAMVALVNVQGGDIYWRDDGGDPNHDIGTLVKQDTSFPVCGSALSSIKFVQSDAPAEINVNYYGTV